MKKLLKKLRDWLIVKLGGFTEQQVAEASDEWMRQMDEASSRISWLEKVNGQQAEKIRGLEFDLSCRSEHAVDLPYAKKAVRQTVEGTIPIRTLFQSPSQERRTDLIKQVKEDLARNMGKELLANGAFTVRERRDNKRDAYVIQMEVEVLC